MLMWSAEGAVAQDSEEFLEEGPDENAARTEKPFVYRLGPGDRLRITVFGHVDLSGEFPVGDSGYISLPLVGEIEAKGVTTRNLERAVIDKLRPDYLKNPRVSVEVIVFRPFCIEGEVATSGCFPYQPGLTVLRAVALAGGYSYRARKSRVVIRRENSSKELTGSSNTPVYPGDSITVKERFF